MKRSTRPLGCDAAGPLAGLDVRLLIEQLHLHREQRQPLVEVVVQVARNAPALVLLRGDQAAGKIVNQIIPTPPSIVASMLDKGAPLWGSPLLATNEHASDSENACGAARRARRRFYCRTSRI